ncbi:hypothetical protein Q5752_003766 [Cryptotrichosporon argae]
MGRFTYHRFLRFYPDGFVISFLTTDHPSDIVPVLRPSLRAKGLHFGRWRLVRSDASEPECALLTPPAPGAGGAGANADAKPPPPRPRAVVLVSDLLEPGAAAPKYAFEMELALRETQRGRWNKLDLSSYRSIHLATGEVLELGLKHQKPFYFSKVRSYNPPL